MKYLLLIILTVLPSLVTANLKAATRTNGVSSMKSECEDYVEETVKNIYAAYEDDIYTVNEIIIQLKKLRQNPAKYNWPGNGPVNLPELRDALVEQRNQDISDLISSNKCPSIEEEISQIAIEIAVAYYNVGWAVVLPKDWTHIDVDEIVDGNITGGKNSFVNQTKKAVYDELGMSTGNPVRQILDNPLQPSKWEFLDHAPIIGRTRIKPKVRIVIKTKVPKFKL